MCPRKFNDKFCMFTNAYSEVNQVADSIVKSTRNQNEAYLIS